MTRRALLALGLACLPAPAQSQPADPALTRALDANLREGKQLIGNAAPLDRAGAGVSGSQFQFSTEKGDTEASLAIKFDLDRYVPEETREEGVYRLSSLSLVITATAPVSSDENATSFGLFSGDNLVSGSRLKLALTRTSSRQKDGGYAVAPMIALKRACAAQELSTWVGTDAKKQALADQYKAAFDSQFASLDDIATMDIEMANVLPKKPGLDGVGSYISLKCGRTKALADLKGYDPELAKRADHAAFVQSPLTFMGLDGSFGRDSYKTLDRPGFKVNEVRKNSWQVAAYWGLIGADLNWSLRARGSYGVRYEAPDEVELCRTVTGSANQECIKAPDGSPQRKKAGLASVEGRLRVQIVDGQMIAFAPQVTYDIEGKEFGAELPIYLAPDEKGKLSGGLKIAYASKQDDVAIGLFIGVPFSIFY